MAKCRSKSSTISTRSTGVKSFSDELGLGGLGGDGGDGTAAPSPGFGSLGAIEGPQGGVGITANSWKRFLDAVRSSTSPVLADVANAGGGRASSAEGLS